MKIHDTNRMMSVIGLIVLFLIGAQLLIAAAPGVRQREKITNAGVTWQDTIHQGFGLQVWLANTLVMGKMAFDNGNPPSTCGGMGIGCEYPAGSCIEHLYGAGPWIGGIQDGVRKVTESYNGDLGYGFTIPQRGDTLRDRMWVTSTADTAYDSLREGYYKRPMNRRGFDDDGDGKIDEDELDGIDNDHDWVRATDDIGADGIPDSLETGCKGVYDPVRNPDPAYDNFNPTKYDSCHPNPDSSLPLMKNKDRYTELNGVPDHGEPHVDEDYGALSDHDVYFGATDTFHFPAYPTSIHNPLGIKVFQKSYAWKGNGLDAALPMEYYFINIGAKPISSCYIGFFMDTDVGPLSVGTYYQNNFAAYLPDLHTAYVQDPIDRGSTPLGLTVFNTPKPLSQLKYIFKWYDFTTKPGPGTRDSNLYAWMSGEAFPSLLIDPDQPSTSLSDTRLFFSFGPFDTLKPGDTLKIGVSLVSGYCVDGCTGSMVENVHNSLTAFGQMGLVGVRQGGQSSMPSLYHLEQNYPNPFNPVTTIRYSLPEESFVTVSVYDILGQRVATLVNGRQPAGDKSVSWSGHGMASGVYFYRLDAVSQSNAGKRYSEAQKMLLVQ